MEFAPDVFLIGAPKCGTTALSHWLRAHPQLFLPDRKEPHHFSGPFPNDRHKNPVMDPRAYQALYHGDGLYVDASTSYLASDKARMEIKRRRPDAKIMICLRNPVKQVWSGAMMMEKFRNQSPETWLNDALRKFSAGNEVQAIEAALYGKYVPAWVHDFDCHIVESDTMRLDPQSVFDGICDYLSIPHAPTFTLSHNAANQYQTPRNSFAKRILNSSRLTRMARMAPLRVRQCAGGALLRPAKKPEMPAIFPERLWPIFEPDLAELRQQLDRKFPTLGP